MNSSAARHAANLANAQNSTGPKTEAGKARSSQNAARHGFSASFAIVTPEDQPIFAGHSKNLREEIDPAGPLEDILFNQLLLASWNLRRIERAQHELFTQSGIDPLLSTDPAVHATLDRLNRYHARNDRAFHRSLKELKALQNHRAAAEQRQDLLPDPAPALADPDRVAKRTQSVIHAEQHRRRNEVESILRQFEAEGKTLFEKGREWLQRQTVNRNRASGNAA